MGAGGGAEQAEAEDVDRAQRLAVARVYHAAAHEALSGRRVDEMRSLEGLEEVGMRINLDAVEKKAAVVFVADRKLHL